MAQRHGAVRLRQQRRHGFAHDIAAAQHDTPLSRRGNAIFLQHFHDSRRGTGLEHRIADVQPPHVVGVEAVHILFRGDGGDHRRLLQGLGQGQLHQNTVHRRITIQFFNEVQQFPLGGLRRKPVGKAADAALSTVRFLTPDIDLRGGVLPYQHHRQPRLTGQLGGFLRYLGLYLGRKGFSVNSRCHASLPFPVSPVFPYPERSRRQGAPQPPSPTGPPLLPP